MMAQAGGDLGTVVTDTEATKSAVVSEVTRDVVSVERRSMR
jgi:hypothetical protein